MCVCGAGLCAFLPPAERSLDSLLPIPRTVAWTSAAPESFWGLLHWQAGALLVFHGTWRPLLEPVPLNKSVAYPLAAAAIVLG